MGNGFDALSDNGEGIGNSVSQIAREAFPLGHMSRGPTQWGAISLMGGNMAHFGKVEDGTYGAGEIEAGVENVDQESYEFRVEVASS